MAAPSLLNDCLQKTQACLQILYVPELANADVADFIGAAQQVDTILRKINDTAYFSMCTPTSLSLKIFLRSLENLTVVLDEYSGHLMSLYQDQKLAEVLNSVNLRRRLEQLNGSLLTDASILEEKHSYLGRDVGVASTPSVVRPIDPGAQAATDDKVPITDPAAKQMWITQLEGNFMVEWPKFVKVFTETLGSNLNPDQKKVVKQILDNNNTGFVSAARFNEFCRGFGPFHSSLKNVDKLLNQPWFFGFMTMDEARKFLEFQPVNTFLVRFSGTKPGSFALAFASDRQRVSHVHITTTESGFSVKQQDEEKVFSNLYEIVQFYNTVLKVPFASQLPYEDWFHGDIDSTQADKYLAGKKVGTFLIRFSSQPGYFAGSYVDDNNLVGKCLIASSPRFYIADNEGAQYGQFDTMSDLVHAFSSIFKFSYKKGTNDQQEQMRARIARELLETEKTYARAMRTVDHVFMRDFDVSLPKNAKVLSADEYRSIFCNTNELADAHEALVRELEPVISQWHDESVVGRIMLDFRPKLDVYTPYVNNYNNSMATLNRCMARPQFKKQMDALMQRPEVDQNNYTAYTIQPIQRVPRYILLLSDLLKHTDDSHPDYELLSEALDEIKITADDINEKKRIADDAARLQDMNDRLAGSPGFSPQYNRAVLHDGPMFERDGKKYADRYCWLLDDGFIVAKMSKPKSKKDAAATKYQFLRELPVRGMYATDVPDSKIDKNAFKVTAGGIEGVFATEMPGPKAMWMNKIKEAANDCGKEQKAQIQRSSTMNIVTRGISGSNAPALYPATSPQANSPASSGGAIPSQIQQVPNSALQRSMSMGPISGPMSPKGGVATTVPGRPGMPGMRTSADTNINTPPQIPLRSGSVGFGIGGAPSGVSTPTGISTPPVAARRLSSNLHSAPGLSHSSPSLPIGDGQPLPAGWKEAYSADGRLYFYNTLTKKTSWQKPTAEPAPAATASPGPLPPDWKEARTNDGKVYWYHAQSKETTWKRPT